MGIDVIQLGGQGNLSDPLAPRAAELGRLSFSTHHIANPQMSIWMMSTPVGQALLPWWKYTAKADQDIEHLNNIWLVNSAQSFFDCLFLSQLRKTLGSDLYWIVSGNLRGEGWSHLPEDARASYLRSQGCVYRLEGEYNGRLNINWVPFGQPQALIKQPSFQSLWPMFVHGRTDDVANSISFFSLSDAKKLPQVVGQLIQQNENRSIDLTSMVDWFGCYTSPLTPEHSACAAIYAKERSAVERLQKFQEEFKALIDQARSQLEADLVPHTAYKILSRFIAI